MFMNANEVYLFTECEYDEGQIKQNIVESGVLSCIKKGDKVVLKPNFVQEKHELNDDWDYLITHPTVITATLDLVSSILSSTGEIIIADAPMTPAKFDEILAHMPVSKWKEMCAERKVDLSIIDLRDEEWHNAENGIILEKKDLPGDPKGKVLTNLLDDNSEFFGKANSKQGLYGACYDIRETNDAHNGHDNKYSVSRTIIEADVFINLPKLKTHKKAGITCCLKNLVGINTNKNLLPHHTTGTPSEGGDQFSDSTKEKKLESAVTIYAKKIVHAVKFLTPFLVPLKNLAIKVWGDNRESIKSGGWYGNDTLWRTIIDLNKVLLYANRDGSFREDNPSQRKRYISIVDGILAGEGNGPLAPDKIEANVMLCGIDPVAIDCTATRIMGLSYAKIPSVFRALKVRKYRITDYEYVDYQCIINGKMVCTIDDIPKRYLHAFRPALGWINQIELQMEKFKEARC
jgi:uncharacterized protein (DUF362 family)